MRRFANLVRLFGIAASIGPLLAACSPIGLAISAAGIATDTSMTWDIVKHVHGKFTEDDPTPCAMLNSVQRALNARCEYRPGSIRSADIARSGLQDCPLALATRDPRLWRALPELIEQGATAEQCPASPLVALADSNPCPDFASAPAPVREALVGLARDDPRAVRHDVFRMLSCPGARAAGLDTVLTYWLDHGALEPGKLSFSPLDAADPELLLSRFGHELEVAGHRPETALDSYDGALPSGFEVALRNSNWAALEWWLYRLPRLANLAPPQRGGQLAWVPLQRVLLPGYLAYPTSQRDMVAFLIAHGADPRQKLPFDSAKTVLVFAAQMKSPMLALLEAPATPPPMPMPMPRPASLAVAKAGGVGGAAPRDVAVAASAGRSAASPGPVPDTAGEASAR
ncbi:MAG: hypothetical protein M3Z29_15325 [Pseudomonadota bacterium]|nr:hypothetical protein [Pseudomonadota bacterium]